MKPTGRIVLRDLGDSYLLEDFVKNTKFAWIMNRWEKDRLVSGKINTGIGFLHGNEKPNWLTGLEYKEYNWHFYRVFEDSFSKITNIPIGELSKVDSKDVVYSYSRKVYPTTSSSWQNYVQRLACKDFPAKCAPEVPAIKLPPITPDCIKGATRLMLAH